MRERRGLGTVAAPSSSSVRTVFMVRSSDLSLRKGQRVMPYDLRLGAVLACVSCSDRSEAAGCGATDAGCCVAPRRVAKWLFLTVHNVRCPCAGRP